MPNESHTRNVTAALAVVMKHGGMGTTLEGLGRDLMQRSGRR